MWCESSLLPEFARFILKMYESEVLKDAYFCLISISSTLFRITYELWRFLDLIVHCIFYLVIFYRVPEIIYFLRIHTKLGRSSITKLYNLLFNFLSLLNAYYSVTIVSTKSIMNWISSLARADGL